MARDGFYPKRVKTTFIGEGIPEIVEVEVPEREAPPLKKDDDLKHIGRSYSRLEAEDIVTGKAKFTGDIFLPGMVYGKLIRSDKPRARVISIDTSGAEASPGVKGVVLLDREEIFYSGQILGAVAAVSEQAAADAVRAVKVEYEELPFVVSADRAMRPNAPQTTTRENISPPRPIERGNIVEGFAEADQIIEREYTTQVEIHQPLEPHSTVVSWDNENLLLYEASQTIYYSKSQIVGLLRRDFPEWNVTANKVRVLCEHTGGAFGSKIGFNNHIKAQVMLAKKINLPVRIVLDRYEQSVDAGNRPDSIQKYKIGAMKDGTITAMELQGYCSGGVGGGDGLTQPIVDMYKCPNIKAVSQSVFTNTGPGKPFRAPGHVQAFFGFESLIDELAHEMNIDPVELRKKNFTDREAGGTGRPYSSNGLLECYEKGAKAIGWERRNVNPSSDPGTKKKGMGVAALQWFGVGEPNSTVEADIYKDGSVDIKNGTQDIGTGTRTIMAQVAAEDLGLEINDVNILIGDTNYPPGSPSWGSINASSTCPAVRTACYEALRKLFPIAASKLGVTPEELDVKNGNIFVTADPEKIMNFKEVASLLSEDKVTGSGKRRPNPNEYAGNTFGAQFCEVEVDTATGVVKVLKVVPALDSGRIINPLTCDNQVIGGVNQAIGYALLEERIMDDRTGRMTNPNLHDYKIMPATEAPDIEIIYADIVDNLQNNIGCKGVGEPPTISLAASVANAVYNAAGVRIRSIPITPDKVLDALRKEGRS